MSRRVFILLCLGLIGVVGLSQLSKLNGAVQELTLPLNHASVIRQQARAKDLDPYLIAAVIYAETKFNPRPSSAGAEGLMQILPSTALFIAKKSGGTAFVPTDLGDPQVNIRYGSWYLRYLLQRYDGDTTLAVASYNAGMGNVDKWVASAKAGGHALRVDEIPFPETKAYVERVLSAKSDYEAKYSKELSVR
ncbi:MAG: lytic transglycosylase domain-containing protein [Actinomycetes bacterium]